MNKISRTKTPWNKGLIAGQKLAFTIDEIAHLEENLLLKKHWHDLALLSFGLDTMFRSSDLLATQVWQVTYQNGTIRSLIARRRRSKPVHMYKLNPQNACICGGELSAKTIKYKARTLR